MLEESDAIFLTTISKMLGNNTGNRLSFTSELQIIFHFQYL
jgi:hypothetical protein